MGSVQDIMDNIFASFGDITTASLDAVSGIWEAATGSLSGE